MDNNDEDICHVRFCRPVPKMMSKSEYEEFKKTASKKEIEFFDECVDKYYWSRGREFPMDDDI